MEYKKITSDGYILGVAEVESGGNIDKDDFDEITKVIHDMPTAPEGFFYRLKENLEWELCKIDIRTEGDTL